jgi:hypothetical protein
MNQLVSLVGTIVQVRPLYFLAALPLLTSFQQQFPALAPAPAVARECPVTWPDCLAAVRTLEADNAQVGDD